MWVRVSVGYGAPYRGDDAVLLLRGGEARERLTSGKVPLEKTLRWQSAWLRRARAPDGGCEDSHEKTSLSTGTVTNNDQLATDFRHLRERVNERRDPGKVW